MPLVTTIKPSFSAGELAPSVWGRVDFAKWHIGASVMRNCFVSYRGPASSRAGLAFVGQSLTPASAFSLPPKLVRFQFNIFQAYVLEFGVDATGRPYLRVIANGGYVTETPIAVTNATQANPGVVTAPAHGFANNDWVFGATFTGMTQLNGRTFAVQNATANTFTLADTFGNPVSTLNFGAYVGAGTFARVYTNFNSPYQLADLPFLKFVQSADVMSLCLVNQESATEYAPIDLSRIAANNWSFVPTSFGSVIAAPTGAAATSSIGGGATPTQYAYVVTAVDAATGEESVASNVANITNSDDIALVAGSHTITWNPVAGASFYNIYQAPPSYDTAVPVGSVFAFVGFSYGTSFVNSNIFADQTVTPPLHLNPFARGQILGVGVIPATGSFAQATTTAVINSATGSGGVIIPVVDAGSSHVVAGIVQNGGAGYKAGDTWTATDSGSGNSVTAPLSIGPQSGTYPSEVNYFQQRRDYSGTLNNPDTKYYSQVGAYTNMDSATPPVDSDAIVLTPWGQQVNGIQWSLPMPGGEITGTGQDAWQVSGAGGPGSPLTPSSQSAIPQESNGFSPTVRPLRINYNIVYLQELGNTVRELQYNFFNNIYAGTDLSYISNHLFEGFQITSWAWAKLPYKIIWATRDDGRFLSLTYDKEEQLQGWARHDTNGLMAGVEVVTEPPVSAPYFVVKRFIPGAGQWAYYIERMDNRLWSGPEDPWCVDAGLALTQPAPNATLSAAAAQGPGTITGGYLATPGQGYTNPSAQVVDPAGAGSGGQVTLTQTGGAITGFAVVPGQNYSPATFVRINDPTGAGATFVPFISQNVVFNASAPVFTNTQTGDVIRIGGGQAVVSVVNTPSQVLAAIRAPILATIPNDPNNLPISAGPGRWTITTPVQTVTNLNHLEGMQVTGLYDGNVIPPATVTGGALTLPAPATSIVIGLPFLVQLQSLHAPDLGPEVVQGKRKVTPGVNVRLEKTRGIQIGANQPVASALDFQQEIPWTNLVDLPDYASSNVPAAALPLFTGDKFQPINDDWHNWNGFEASPGMIAVQQSLPLPMNVLALVPNWEVGDQNG